MSSVAARKMAAMAATAARAAQPPRAKRVVDNTKVTRIAQDLRALNATEFELFRSKLSNSFAFPGVSKLLADLEEKASKIDVNAVVQPVATAAADAAPAASAAAAAAAEPVPVAKASFDLKLESYAAGDKIKIIKVVRELLSLGLKETKEKVEGIPIVLKNDMLKEDADAWVEKLKAAGAKVVLE